MAYEIAWIILAIFFWVLCAAATILLGAWIYIQLMYYHWNKQDRMQQNIVHQVIETVNDKVEETENIC